MCMQDSSSEWCVNTRTSYLLEIEADMRNHCRQTTTDGRRPNDTSGQMGAIVVR